MTKRFLPELKPLDFLAGLTEASIEAARLRPGETAGSGYPANSQPFTLIRPGGRACYPAVWIQDFALTLATGFVTPEETWNHLRLIAEAQNGPRERRLKGGAVVPAFAIPDHVLFDGKAVYFPGTYSSGQDQGGEPWGILPPVNNHYDFILIAHQLRRVTGRVDFLRKRILGLSLIERLRKAFLVPRVDDATGLVFTDAKRRAVGFIFCDSIYMTGYLLFASLLRWRAALQLAELEETLGNSKKAAALHATAAVIPRHLAQVFSAPEELGGWLRAATGTGRQADVWGTIYALHLGVLDRKTAKAARVEIVKALEEGTICYQGAVRHVPVNRDASPDSAWEKTPTPHNHYQNGAWWHTPTGWLVAVLAKHHPEWAARIFKDMMIHLKREDFRKGPEYGAPLECFGKKGEARNNPVFLGSVAVPYGVLSSLGRAKRESISRKT